VEKSKRKSNIELLRILAMIMVVGYHYVLHGIQASYTGEAAYNVWEQGSLANRIFASLLEPGGQVGVAIFFMITGYFQILREKFTVKKVVIECAFYGVILGITTLIYMGVAGQGLPLLDPVDSFENAVKMIFNPASSGVWWFVTAYLLLLVLSPLVNKFFQRLNARGRKAFLILFWALWYSISMLRGETYTGLERALFFYLMGGYVRLEGKNERGKKFYGLVALLAWLLGSAAFYARVIPGLFDYPVVNEMQGDLRWSLINSVGVPICAYASFKLFCQMDLGSKEWMNKIATTTFGIYLIHDSMIGRGLIWHGILKVQTRQYMSVWFPLWSVLTVLGVFIVCAGIDWARQKFVEPALLGKVDQVGEKLRRRYGK